MDSTFFPHILFRMWNCQSCIFLQVYQSAKFPSTMITLLTYYIMNMHYAIKIVQNDILVCCPAFKIYLSLVYANLIDILPIWLNALYKSVTAKQDSKIFSKFWVATLWKKLNFAKHEGCVGYLVAKGILSIEYVADKSTQYINRGIYSFLYHSLIIRNGTAANFW